MTELVPHDLSPVMDRVVIGGDLSLLTPAQRLEYYSRTCQSLGLNPLTKPFAFIKLNGKVVLYALRDAADQLRRIHKVSIEIVDRKIANGLLTIHVRAKMPDGRQDEDVGVLAWNDNLAGDAAANQLMKGITKAKRRVTLSICGLGMLDETEAHTIPDAEFIEFTDAGEVVSTPVKQSRTQAKTGRKSSYESKKEKDGGKSEGDFNGLRKKIADSGGPVECIAIWITAHTVLKTMARVWFDLLAEEFVDKMEDHGVKLDIDEFGWPIIPVQEAAA